MADYVQNIKKYNMIFQNRLKVNNLMKKPPHECDYHALDKTRENKVTTKKISYMNRARQNPRFIDNNGTKNPFKLSPDQRLFINVKGIENHEVKKPFVMSEPLTICDIDKDFYKLVKGRPIRSYLDHKQYLTDITTTTIERLNAAYIKDLIFQFESSRHTYEEKQYQKAIELYNVINEHFRLFLEDSWESVNVANAKADAQCEKMLTVLDHYDKYRYDFVTKKNEINNLRTTSRNLNKYRRFLYTVAPIEWRLLYDDEFEGINNYFDNHEAYSAPSITSLEMVTKSLIASTDLVPQLYFKTSTQLINILEDIRAQSLNYIQMHALRTDIIKTLIKNKDYLKRLISKDAQKLQEKIDIFEQNIKKLNEQEILLKRLFDNLLARKFKKLYASWDSAKLLQCLQDVNSALISDIDPKVPSDSLFDLAQELENLYMKLTSDLDKLDSQVVMAVKNKVFAESLKTMTLAKRTHRQLRELDILKKNLYASFEPPRHKKVADNTIATHKSV